MSKYTAEQARSSLQKMHGHPLMVAERAELFSMASNYADLLREHEFAEYVDFVQRFGAKHGVFIPDPEA